MSFELETQLRDAEAELARIDATRPVLRWSAYLSSAAAKAQFHADLDAWGAAHPEAKARREELLGGINNLKEALRESRAVARRNERTIERLKAMGVGERTIGALQSPRQTQALKALSPWAFGGGWALVLVGGPGAGKTVAAAQAAFEALQRGETVEWVATLQASRANAFGPEAEARERAWMGADLLVVDDVGAEFASDAWRSILGAVLDARWGNNLSTLLTSNLTLPELKERLGARTMDRIAQDGMVVACGDVSLRRSA